MNMRKYIPLAIIAAVGTVAIVESVRDMPEYYKCSSSIENLTAPEDKYLRLTDENEQRINKVKVVKLGSFYCIKIQESYEEKK
jgi:hypothetical protein